MAIPLRDQVKLIREKSDPEADAQAAIRYNARLLDCLYRLSFTSDKVRPSTLDFLASQLQKHDNEVTVLLGRILNVATFGLHTSQLQDIQSTLMEDHSIKVVLSQPQKDKPAVYQTHARNKRKRISRK